MFETYPKGGKTTHKKGKHETDSLPGCDSSRTKYPKKGAGMNGIDTNESKQSKRAPFAKGGGSAQKSAHYPKKKGGNGSFGTDCNY